MPNALTDVLDLNKISLPVVLQGEAHINLKTINLNASNIIRHRIGRSSMISTEKKKHHPLSTVS
jgi:hypothetical protein